MENLPGLPKKTEEYKTPLRAASFAAARASDEDDQSLRGHHLPEIIEKKKNWFNALTSTGGQNRW